jgi:ketosteroid isomerase-like protein
VTAASVRAVLEAVEWLDANLDRLIAGEELPLPDVYAEDVEFVNFEPSPFPGTYRGHTGIRQWAQEVLETINDAHIEVAETVEKGDLVAGRMKIDGKGRSTGIQGTLEWGCLFELRNGRIVRASSDLDYETTLDRLTTDQ